MKKAWIYIRSTPVRPPSSQRHKIQQYLDGNNITILGEEIERPQSKGFPALKRVIKKAGEDLIILSNAKSLLKSTAFLHELSNAHDFAILNSACTPDTLEVFKEKARKQRESQSKNLSKTFQKMKSKGIKLGATRPGFEHIPQIFIQNIEKGQKISAQVRRQRSKQYYADIIAKIVELREQGLSDQAVASELNDADLTMQNGNLFHQVSVLRLVKRTDKQPRKPGRRNLTSEEYKTKFPFKSGPYNPPRVAIGDIIIDHFTDKAVEVVDKQDGWPVRKNGSPILTGDLVLAALAESTNSIFYHWKIPYETIRAWKEKLAGRSRNIRPLLAQKLEEVKRNADTWAIRQ